MTINLKTFNSILFVKKTYSIHCTLMLVATMNTSIVSAQAWTSNSWQGVTSYNNGSAIGWKKNNSNYAAGIGHSNGGTYFFRSLSEVGNTQYPSIYDVIIGDDGILKTTQKARINNTTIGGFTSTQGYTDGVSGLYSLHLNAEKTSNTGGNIVFLSAGVEKMRMTSTGLGIGQTAPTAALDINGTVIMGAANNPKAVRVIGGICVVPTASQFCPDYVFENNYPLRSIEEMDGFIKANKHLPGVKSAKEVAQSDNGVNMIDMSYSLLEKVEELSLYIIQLNDRIKALEKDNEVLIKMAKEKGN